MSQYQPNAAPGRSFIEKINSKFSSLSVSSSLHHHSDKDGSSETDTLIHKAFVNYFESRDEPFPEWLGVKEHTRTNKSRDGNGTSASGRTTDSYMSQTNGNSKFQPVRAAYNSIEPSQNDSRASAASSNSRSGPVLDAEADERPYSRRTNSRLQQMYNKTRQNSVAGSGYSGQSQQSQPAQNPSAARSNSSSSRLRDRVTLGNSYSGEPSARPTWGNR